ncbi:MAG: shikimate dehydrogenase family protein [Solirubrobacteraceae bacterium]
MAVPTAPRRLGVLGWPVAHSRSPAMHNAALLALGMEGWRYQALPVGEELFEETVRALGAAGFAGANVTIPHKQAALALADRASDAAREIGAANTLTFEPGGGIAAENTDAPGLIAALGRLGGLPAHPSALVLGAGGSARAAVWALLGAGAREVSVWNRTPERADAVARELGARAVNAPVPAELLVNCTSVGLGRSAGEPLAARPSGPIERSASELAGLNQLGLTFDQVGKYPYVVDFVYSSDPTPLLVAARAHAAGTVDGLEILVEQGALSLELWTGREAPREVMRRAAEADDDSA